MVTDIPAAWLRRIVVTLGPLEEWRGLSSGTVVRFESDGTPNGLKVTGSFHKSLMGQPETSTITVTNLARDTRDAIKGDLTKITVQTGWRGSDLHTLFQGSVQSAVHNRSGADVITRITALPGLGARERGTSAKTYAPGTPVKDVITDLASDMPGLQVSAVGIEGVEGIVGGKGWTHAGKTAEGLNRLSVEYGFSWHIDNGAFKAVGNKAAFGDVLELNGGNGGLVSVTPLLSGPMQRPSGVSIQALYVPGVSAGSLVRVNSTVSPGLNGAYKVNTVTVDIDSHSDQWNMNIESLTAQE